MQSNNPVFARSEPLARSLQQGVGFHTPAPSADHLSAMYRAPSGMTLDDVIVKTGLLLAVGLVLWLITFFVNRAMWGRQTYLKDPEALEGSETKR